MNLISTTSQGTETLVCAMEPKRAGVVRTELQTALSGSDLPGTAALCCPTGSDSWSERNSATRAFGQDGKLADQSAMRRGTQVNSGQRPRPSPKTRRKAEFIRVAGANLIRQSNRIGRDATTVENAVAKSPKTAQPTRRGKPLLDRGTLSKVTDVEKSDPTRCSFFRNRGCRKTRSDQHSHCQAHSETCVNNQATSQLLAEPVLRRPLVERDGVGFFVSAAASRVAISA